MIAIIVAFVVVIHVQCLVSVYLSLVKIKYSVCVCVEKIYIYWKRALGVLLTWADPCLGMNLLTSLMTVSQEAQRPNFTYGHLKIAADLS